MALADASKPLDWFGSGGLRNFTIPEEELGIGDKDDEEHGGVYAKRGGIAGGLYSPPRNGGGGGGGGVHYQYNKLKSKRFKRVMYTCLLLVGVIVISVTAAKINKERSLPDWNKELDEEEENEKKEKSEQQQQGNYIDMAIKYKPIWFSRDDTDYPGTTYDAALEYCSSQNPEMFPCPYEAYCPGGSTTLPLVDTREVIKMQRNGHPSWIMKITGSKSVPMKEMNVYCTTFSMAHRPSGGKRA